jgi:CheY-like chemotaxis protein
MSTVLPAQSKPTPYALPSRNRMYFPAAVKSWGEISIIERKEIPSPIVIMLTNYPYPQYREKCQALGADYFFDKVTEIEKIYDTFQQLLTDKS